MSRKRALLYEILGERKQGLKKRSSTSVRKPSRGRRKGPGRPSRTGPPAWWRAGRRPALTVGVVFLVVSVVAYYIGTLGNGDGSRQPGPLRRDTGGVSLEPQNERKVSPPALRQYWTVQVISYDDTPKGRERARDLMEDLTDYGFEDVHGLESAARRKIAVAVGRHQRKETLESLVDEIQVLKIRNKRPFASAHARRVTTNQR